MAGTNGLVIYTWGYQGRSVDDLRDAVREYGIDKVIDVRGNPYSRRPEWRKEGLETSLGDRYVWLGWLGNRNYNDVGEPEFVDAERGMGELAFLIEELGSSCRILLMCYERKWQDCHRAMIVEMAHERFPEMESMHL